MMIDFKNVLPHDMETARTLTEALPYMHRFSGQTFVIKYGGAAMVNNALSAAFASDIVLIKQVGINPVVVHGGGPQIDGMLSRLNIKSSFVDGLRITDAATMEVVEMVLSGSINKRIVAAINEAGGSAVGLSGKDGQLVKAQRLQGDISFSKEYSNSPVNLGHVGTPTEINGLVLESLAESALIPVIAPIASGPKGETLNINADTAAGAIAGALGAQKLVMLTDVPGVLDSAGQLVSELTPKNARLMITSKVISGGMIPKVKTCLEAIKVGCSEAHILDGRVPHALLLEIFTELGIGTKISKN